MLQWTAPPPTPDVRPVNPEENFYHGTRAEPFKRPLPGTCFTRDTELALFHSDNGSYYAVKAQEGVRRVVSATIRIPEGAAFIPASQMLSEYLNMLAEEKITSAEHAKENALAQREIRTEYHAEARQIAKALGMVAYFADLYRNQEERALVVLELQAVTIVHQNVREILLEKASLSAARSGEEKL